MTVSAAADVDRLIDERPGRELLVPKYDREAFPVADFIYRSAGTTASYCVVTDAERMIVNTGMGFEAPHHRRLFDAVHPGPTAFIVTTQAHVDHVGGVALFRDPGTMYLAQANNPACQHDDQRIQALRMSTAQIWFDLMDDIKALIAENPGVPITQDVPTPDVLFDATHAFELGELEVELHSTPGGETIDASVVWFPQHRIAMVSNLFGPLFPHFPNFNTLRGDRYRFVEPYLRTVDTVRSLGPDVLITGRHTPIVGRELIDASLDRLHGAVDYVHTETLAGMNAGTDISTLMREIRLPDHLRVGQGYGKVSWGVRTIWESYVGWFKLRSTTELYPEREVEAAAELVALAGADAVVARAAELARTGEPVLALHLAEAVLWREPDHLAARAVMVDSHQALLDRGGDVSFWENGWLRHQMERYADPGPTPP